jgi:hypothetical protein
MNHDEFYLEKKLKSSTEIVKCRRMQIKMFLQFYFLVITNQ